jgi:hypothetical protein
MARAAAHHGDRVWLVLCIALSSAWCVTAGRRLGVTFDEPTYVAVGLERWRTGAIDPLMRLGVMPLPVDVMTLPIRVAELLRGKAFDIAANSRGDVQRHRDLAAVLPMARASTIAFWILLLTYGWLAGRDIAGSAGGNIAVAFLGVEPSLLAHASLATTDIAVSACLLALGYHFRRGLGGSWPRRIALPGLWFGLAILSKASALLFGPLILAAVWLERLSRSDLAGSPVVAGPGPWRLFARDLTAIAAIGLAVAFLYCGSAWHEQPTFVAWANGLPDSAPATALRLVAEHLKIFSNAGEGIVRQLAHNVRGHGTYILGRTDARAVWYYFPLALTIKVSAPILILSLSAILLWPRSCRNWLLLAAGLMLVASLACRVQTGIRLVQPLLIAIATGTAAAIGEAWRTERRPIPRAVLRALAIAGVAWTAANDGRSWPDAIRFMNELWGGTARGYERLSDSNYDWGQGLPPLRAWQQSAGVKTLDIWYWGTDPAACDPGWRVRLLHTLRPSEIQPSLNGRYLAASTTLLYGSVLAGPISATDPNAAQWATAGALRSILQARAPIARTSTFLIYDFTAPQKTVVSRD